MWRPEWAGGENRSAFTYYWYYDHHADMATGNRAIGEMVAQRLLDAAASVVEAPLREEERGRMEEPLPEPMLQKNFETANDRWVGAHAVGGG